jgi:hypothetical protein
LLAVVAEQVALAVVAEQVGIELILDYQSHLDLLLQLQLAPVEQGFLKEPALLVLAYKDQTPYLALSHQPEAVEVVGLFKVPRVVLVEDLLIITVQVVPVIPPLQPLHREIMEVPQVQLLSMVEAVAAPVQ